MCGKNDSLSEGQSGSPADNENSSRDKDREIEKISQVGHLIMSEIGRLARSHNPPVISLDDAWQSWTPCLQMCDGCYAVFPVSRPKCPLRRRKSTAERYCFAAVLKKYAKRLV